MSLCQRLPPGGSCRANARLRERAHFQSSRCNEARGKTIVLRAPSTASGPPFLPEEGFLRHPFTGSKYQLHGWQANKKCTCAQPVVLGLCPKMKYHPFYGGYLFAAWEAIFAAFLFLFLKISDFVEISTDKNDFSLYNKIIKQDNFEGDFQCQTIN